MLLILSNRYVYCIELGLLMVKIVNLSKKTRYGNQLKFWGFVTIIQLVFNSSFARICHSIMINTKCITRTLISNRIGIFVYREQVKATETAEQQNKQNSKYFF